MSLYLEPTKRRILASLSRRPASLFPLAAELDEPPFLIRAELKALRRLRLVNDRIEPPELVWQLTDKGQAHAQDLNQLELS